MENFDKIQTISGSFEQYEKSEKDCEKPETGSEKSKKDSEKSHVVNVPFGTKLLTLTQGTALQGYTTLMVLPMAMCSSMFTSSKSLKMVCYMIYVFGLYWGYIVKIIFIMVL